MRRLDAGGYATIYAAAHLSGAVGLYFSFALDPSSAWRTPLGDVVVDRGLAERLLALCPSLEEDAEAHRREHSLEVQLPFLLERLGSAQHHDRTFAAIALGLCGADIPEGRDEIGGLRCLRGGRLDDKARCRGCEACAAEGVRVNLRRERRRSRARSVVSRWRRGPRV